MPQKKPKKKRKKKEKREVFFRKVIKVKLDNMDLLCVVVCNMGV